MSVACYLGLVTPDDGLLAEATMCWSSWAESDRQLDVVTGPAELRRWLPAADPAAADSVLHALARLGSPTGGDQRPASGVLAWVLLPGACALAHRLRTLSARIDELVAAQLWVEVRSFAWQRLRKVAANILANTRTGVLRECEAPSQLQRVDPTWRHTRTVDPHSLLWSQLIEADPIRSGTEELLDLLEWACQAGVIDPADRSLLLCLVEVADRLPVRRTGRGTSGLMANDLSAAVAARCGIAPVTVRRRTRRTLSALTAACTGLPCAA